MLETAGDASPRTSAVIATCPAAAWAGGATVKRVVTASSSRVKATGADAGDAVHPAGVFRLTVAFAAPLPPFTTVTRTSRPRPAPPADARSGTTAIFGDTSTANAGTTLSSMRFSPISPVPS